MVIHTQIRNSLNHNGPNGNNHGRENVNSKGTAHSSQTHQQTTREYPTIEYQQNEKDTGSNERTTKIPERRISMPAAVSRYNFSPNVARPSTLVMDDKDALIKSLQGEIVSLQDVIKSRDNEILKLRREVHKLKVITFCFTEFKVHDTTSNRLAQLKVTKNISVLPFFRSSIHCCFSVFRKSE